ncbi:MAG: Crp/Fnr family transcriptional regulator [Peptococcaceae bacterium]|nr:Crp/Fnr family transcriptional regulator [Peptococcaceae bacterium]
MMNFKDLPNLEPCFFKKGSVLIQDGDRVDYVYYLRKGTVYREIVTDTGVESILSCKEGGGLTDSIIGILLLYGHEAPYISGNNFVAGTDCYCLRIPVDVIKGYLHTRPELLEELVGTAIHECGYLMNLYLGKSEAPAPAALCTWMLERLEKRVDGQYLPSYHHDDIAKFLNLHKVTVSRIFSALRREGVLEKTDHGLRVRDMSRLRDYADNRRHLRYS